MEQQVKLKEIPYEEYIQGYVEILDGLVIRHTYKLVEDLHNGKVLVQETTH